MTTQIAEVKPFHNKNFDDLIDITKKTLILLEEQKSDIKWYKGVKKSFDGVIKLVKEVEQYRRKKTMSLTWKGHSNSTRYL